MFNLTRQEQIAAGFVITAFLIGTLTLSIQKWRMNTVRTDVIRYGDTVSRETGAPPAEESGRESRVKKKEIVIHITGAVEKPGVYRLREGARVEDAVEMAIPAENADLDRVNLAQVVYDAQKIMIPAQGGTAAADEASAGPISETDWIMGGDAPVHSGEPKLNINNATQGELEALPGVGPALASQIIKYREHRRFTRIEDLLKINGIGTKRYERIREQVCVR